MVRRVVYADRVHFVIDQADGSRALLPEWMTEPWAAALPVVDVPRLPLEALQALCRLIEANRIVSLPSPATNQRGAMQQKTPWRQLNLLETAQEATQLQQLDPASRAEITALLKQLLNECIAHAVLAEEVEDE